jgi:cation:H+ antiporter
MVYVLLLVGFVLLTKGADYFVDGAARISTKLRIPPMLIGLTVVAFGTSSPEAAVTISAAISGTADIAIGNAIGSNIFVITLVIGLMALFLPLQVEDDTIRKEIPFTLLAGVALLVVISDKWLLGYADDVISRADGVILLLFFAIFLYYIIEAARNSRQALEAIDASPHAKAENNKMAKSTPPSPQQSVWGKSLLLTLGGLIAIMVGGHFVVTSSVEIAVLWGMSETLVGLTVAAIGTSLPELVTSVVAALKKQSDMAIGNIVGSCIFNLLFVLGAASVIIPLPVDSRIIYDLIIMILFTGLLLNFSITNYRIAKWEGTFLVIAYIVYLIFIIIRN